MNEFKTNTLSLDSFPDQDTIYNKYTYEEFEKQISWAQNKIKSSVWKCAQSAPLVIISPRSRGFSDRETLINKYISK